ncbi:MAG: TrkA C-terminal domain-containing protein [Verrucomicrobiales bacterium]
MALRPPRAFRHRPRLQLERLAAVELSKFIRNPDSLVVEEIARGRIELQQIHVSAKADANGKTLRQINFPQRVRVASITRGQEVLVPSADEVIRAGDLVTVFGEPNKLRDAVGRLGKGARDERELNVVIFGGGEYGFSLAQMLESWNCRVRIFDQDPVRCSYLSQRLPNAAVLNADATRLAELREEQVGDADFFVATAGSDEDNVMTCLQAHSLGAKHCLTLIHRADYADAISGSGEHFGIMAAVSPREATRQDLMRFVTSDRYHVVKNLGAGEIIESAVPPGSAMVGRPIRDIGLPPGCVLLAIVHGIHANVPAAEDEIHVGDNVYALVNDKARKKFLKLMGR